MLRILHILNQTVSNLNINFTEKLALDYLLKVNVLCLQEIFEKCLVFLFVLEDYDSVII